MKLVHNLRFWIKTVLYAVVPGGYGYYRSLQRRREPGFDLQTQKHPVRRKFYGGSAWQNGSGDGYRRRDYVDYGEYVTHQVQKFDEMIRLEGGFSNLTIARYRLKFFRRFRGLSRWLPEDALILCAGARQGTEVEVLRDLGFIHAHGIDLNPGPDNPWVNKGDFMHLDAEDAALDMIYSNCLDHAFDIREMFAEHDRVLKTGGFVLYDLPRQEGGPFEAVHWEDEAQIIDLANRYFSKVVETKTEPAWSWFLLQKMGV